LERDTGNIYLTPAAVDASDDDPSNQLLGSSITEGWTHYVELMMVQQAFGNDPELAIEPLPLSAA